MISFNKHVYMVDGACKSCIYDLNSGVLYQIEPFEKDIINDLIGSDLRKKRTKIEEELLKGLLQEKILVDSSMVFDGKVSPLNDYKITLAWIEITKKCNLRCKHCYESSNPNNLSEMSLEDYYSTIDKLSKYGVPNIQLIGGEPLIVGDKIYNMLDYAYLKFKRIEIFTNGTLIDNDFVRYVKKKNIKIALSVYSYDPKEHDRVTQEKGSYERTIKSIKLLKEAKIPYRVGNVLMKDLCLGNKNTDLFSLNPNKDIVRISGRANLRLLDKSLLKRKLITEKRFHKKIDIGLFNRLRVGHNCFCRRIYVDTNMNVFPCVMERRISHGSLKKHTLEDILKEEIIRLGKDNISECKECEYRFACHDCRADALTDNINAKPWYCTYKPHVGEWENEDKFIEKILNKQ